MGMMPEQLAKTIGETLIWASNRAINDGGVPVLGNIEYDPETATIEAEVIPGDQRIRLTIEDITE